MRTEDTQINLSVLGWLYILVALLSLAIGLVSFLFLTRLTAAFSGQLLINTLAAIRTAGLLFFTILALPGLATGFGLLRRRPWALVLARAVSILYLLNFPLGTVVSIYTFWVLPPAGSAFDSLSLKPA